MSNSLWPHGLKHARLPCPTPSPRVCPSSCVLNHCCHPTVSSSVAPFSFCLQSFPASGSFPVSQLFTSGLKYWNFSFSPSNAQAGLNYFRVDWFDLLAVQGTLKSVLQHHSSKALILWCLALFMVQLWHVYVTTRKTITLARWRVCLLQTAIWTPCWIHDVDGIPSTSSCPTCVFRKRWVPQPHAMLRHSCHMIRKPTSVINTKKQKKVIERERLEISSRKVEIPREHFMQRWVQERTEMVGT